MNVKQRVLDKLANRSKNDILRKLKAEFIAEDKLEPFHNRQYVEETIRIFDMLDGDNNEPEDSILDEAISDIVRDIFRHFRSEIE